MNKNEQNRVVAWRAANLIECPWARDLRSNTSCFQRSRQVDA